MKENIQAATRVCRSLKKCRMLSRKWSKLQHRLTIDCITEIHPICYYHSPLNYLQRTRTPPAKVELARWCWQRESRRSSADVRVTAAPAQIVTVTHLYGLVKPVCCFGNKEAMHRGSTSEKALCSHWRGQKLLQESLLGLLSLNLSLVSCCHEKDRFHLS